MAEQPDERDRRIATYERLLQLLGHELRNPLSPIVTATQLMQLRAPEQFQKERAAIERATAQLVTIMDAVLDFVRLEKAQLELELGEVDVAAVVDEVVSSLKVRFEETGHPLHVAVPPGHTVRADHARIARILTIVLDNALRYSKRGGTIEVSSERRDAGIVIAIADAGPGIPIERRATLFDPCAADPRFPRGGLGLGLATASRLVALHEGTFDVADNGSGGTTVTITIPAA